jgi:pimeloyl-ACP methyl ester carboxylesterase
VLAHGFSDNGLGWQPTACDLEAQFAVVLPDARGSDFNANCTNGRILRIL